MVNFDLSRVASYAGIGFNMNFPAPPDTQEILIVSLTPQNLERGVLWFTENHQAIKRALITNGWWQTNACVVETEKFCKPSELARVFLDLGYERVPQVRGRGLYAVR